MRSSPSTTSAVARSMPQSFASRRRASSCSARPEGIEQLGGIDFDEAVFAHVIDAIRDRISDLPMDDPDTRLAIARLRRDCVEAKETLSVDTEVTVPVLLPGVSTSVRLVRSEFEDMIRPALGDTMGAMRRAITSARLDRTTSRPWCSSAARPGSRSSPRCSPRSSVVPPPWTPTRRTTWRWAQPWTLASHGLSLSPPLRSPETPIPRWHQLPLRCARGRHHPSPNRNPNPARTRARTRPEPEPEPEPPPARAGAGSRRGHGLRRAGAHRPPDPGAWRRGRDRARR